MITFFVAGNPATKGSWKVHRGKLRPDNLNERPWADAVAWTAKSNGVRPTTEGVFVDLYFYFSKPKKPTHSYPSRSDVDKLARSVLDSLTGIAWVDDQQVVSLTAVKAYSNSDGPGVRVIVGDWEQ